MQYDLFLALVLIGFIAQIVDGSLGMGYGVICSTFLIMIGISPVYASAIIHSSEIVTTGFSAYFHLTHGNIFKRLLLPLAIAGAFGGFIGAIFLSNFDTYFIKLFVLFYLLTMGIYLFVRFTSLRSAPGDRPSTKFLGRLGFIGGLLDAIGGGGWGQVVTSNLIGRRIRARQLIGTVNVAEFFVTIVISATFWGAVEDISLIHVFALGLGGLIASPFAAKIVRTVPSKYFMLFVPVIIIFISLLQIVKMLG